MNFYTFLFVPMLVFLSFVAPIWIFMHYRSINRSSQSLKEEDRVTIDTMLETIDKLQDRIRALEELLDADHPDWRGEHSHTKTKQAGE